METRFQKAGSFVAIDPTTDTDAATLVANGTNNGFYAEINAEFKNLTAGKRTLTFEKECDANTQGAITDPQNPNRHYVLDERQQFGFEADCNGKKVFIPFKAFLPFCKDRAKTLLQTNLNRELWAMPNDKERLIYLNNKSVKVSKVEMAKRKKFRGSDDDLEDIRVHLFELA